LLICRTRSVRTPVESEAPRTETPQASNVKASSGWEIGSEPQTCVSAVVAHKTDECFVTVNVSIV